MHMFDNIKNFLYDQDYFITWYDKKLYVFNYQKILLLNKDVVKLQFNDFEFLVKGDNLRLIKVTKNELIVNGDIKNTEFIYE